MRTIHFGIFIASLFGLLLICDAADPGTADDKLILLDQNNWRDVLKDEWMIVFHAPWCPACRSLTNIWLELAKRSDSLKITIGKIDVTLSPELSGRFFVTALPTIFHVKDGVFRYYKGPRDLGSLTEAIRNGQWVHMEEISSWAYPASIQMSVVAQFFTMSHHLKNANTYLHEEYNFPVWLAYALFGIMTIFIGALIGLMFVCCVDFLYPVHPMTKEERERWLEVTNHPELVPYPYEDTGLLDDIPDPASSSEDEPAEEDTKTADSKKTDSPNKSDVDNDESEEKPKKDSPDNSKNDENKPRNRKGNKAN